VLLVLHGCDRPGHVSLVRKRTALLGSGYGDPQRDERRCKPFCYGQFPVPRLPSSSRQYWPSSQRVVLLGAGRCLSKYVYAPLIAPATQIPCPSMSKIIRRNRPAKQDPAPPPQQEAVWAALDGGSVLIAAPRVCSGSMMPRLI